MSDIFRAELRDLINRHSLENESNTPDFILADFLLGCLDAWERTCKAREKWYGVECTPGMNNSILTRIVRMRQGFQQKHGKKATVVDLTPADELELLSLGPRHIGDMLTKEMYLRGREAFEHLYGMQVVWDANGTQVREAEV